MLFADKLSFDHPRKTADGYLVGRARAARAGLYDYVGSEIDPTGEHFAADATVKVYRPEAEVFAQDSVASFLMKPITNDHPSQPVTADNWREYAKGVVGKALRDGEYLAFDLVLMDKATIADVESGKRELSNGYQSVIDFTPGETADGLKFDATMTQIRGNHVAIVDKGRAGPMCRIGDAVDVAPIAADDLLEFLTDGQTYNANPNDNKNEPARRETSNPSGGGNPTQDGEARMPHTLMIDGFQVPNVSDEAKAAIEKLQGLMRTADEARTKAEGDVAKLTTDGATKDAEIVTLKKQVEDAKVTPGQLRDAAKAYADTRDTAKKLAPSLTIADDADEASIKKAVVLAKLGDAAKDWNDDQFATSFATMAQTSDASPDPVRNALSGGVTTVGDAKAEYEKTRDKARSNLSERYKGAPAKADA